MLSLSEGNHSVPSYSNPMAIIALGSNAMAVDPAQRVIKYIARTQ